MTQVRSSGGRGVRWSIAGSLVLFAACSDNNSDPAPIVVQPQNHVDVVLRDVHGQPLPLNSVEPYSPRMTCGRCHDVDTIANGYHFQHGRTDATGRIVAQLTEPWDARKPVLSPGMFGKW